ncbi:MAG: hypothetical protein JSS10_08095 [Verrucomicrobia bacterium]|nr:hypothetical protein [Verrucomicrobiota bacterium]
MAGKVDAATTVAPAVPPRDTSPSKGSSSRGVSGTPDSISSAAPVVSRTWGATFKGLLAWPFSTVNRAFWTAMGYIADKIWGKGRIPAQTVPVEMKTWYGSTYITTMNLDTALEKKYITPQQALEKNYCNKEYLTDRGWDIVKFTWKNWRGAECAYEGKLRSAIRDQYITAADAIKAKFVTAKAAVEINKWIKIEDAIKAEAISVKDAMKAGLITKEHATKVGLLKAPEKASK